MASVNNESLILVTGATGAVGPSVVQVLHNAGYTIRTLSIDPPQIGLLPNGVEVRMGDVTDWTAVKSAMQGSKVVIHLAGLLHVVNPPAAMREKYERINVGGTATVVEAAIQASVKRIVFFSTIAVYGNSNGQVLTEESWPRPDTFYAQTKLAAERMVLNAKRSDGLPLGTVLRFGAIYGPQIKGNYLRLLHSMSHGRFIPIGNGYNRRSLIYEKDVARAAVLATEHPAAAGKVYNVSDGWLHTMAQIITTMCEALGRNPPRVSLPVGPVRLAAGILEDIGRKIGYRLPVSRATIDKYTEDIAVSSQRIQTELGFKPQYDLQSGWRETIREMRQMGNL
jgi:nucleoside-diphosphate-sugar epimerase